MNLKHPHVRFNRVPTNSGTYVAETFPTRDELKAHLRVDFDSDDSYIDTLLLVTVSYIEEYCDVNFGETTYQAFWDYAYPIVLINKNFRSVKTTGDDAPVLAQLTSDGTYEALASDKYDLDLENTPIRVHMKSGYSGQAQEINKFRLTFKTVTQKAPKYLYQAALLIAGHWYENRQDVGNDRVYEVPMTSRYLLERYRTNGF